MNLSLFLSDTGLKCGQIVVVGDFLEGRYLVGCGIRGEEGVGVHVFFFAPGRDSGHYGQTGRKEAVFHIFGSILFAL